MNQKIKKSDISEKSFRRKLYVFTGVTCVVIAIAGLFTVSQQRKLKKIAERAFFEEHREFLASRVAFESLQCRRFEKDYFLNLSNRTALKKYHDEWRRSSKGLSKHLDLLLAECNLEQECEMVKDWQEAHIAYQTHFYSVFGRIEKGAIPDSEAANVAMTPGKNEIRKLIVGTSDFSKIQRQRATRSSNELASLIDMSRMTTIALVLLPSILIALLTFVFGKDILQQTRQVLRFRGAMDSSADDIYLIDRKSMQFIDLNRSACTNLGYSREELFEMGPQDIKPLLSREELELEFDKIVSQPSKHGFLQTVHRRKDGSTFPVEISLTSIESESHSTMIASVRDMTEQEKKRLELQRAMKLANSANRSKSEFLANMSHEIRTPMTAILGYSEILKERIVDKENLESIEIIKKNGTHLLGIINDILDLSKIEAGKMASENVEFSPVQLIADVASLMRVRADEKGLTLKVEYDGLIPNSICSDPTRLRQVLINLVGNALKFTSKGSVTIRVCLIENDSVPLLRVDITDTGIGMTKEQLDLIFKPFSQADCSTTRRFGGTGLGLAISRRLANILGGDIVVSTEPGIGSTFSVTIETGSLKDVRMLEAPNEAQHTSDNRKTSAFYEGRISCRILLVEDSPDIQRLIKYLLTKSGAKVETANNGQEAMEFALAAREKENPFDVILMDMQMPVLDGYCATRQLRELDYELPIIALTANAMKQDRKACIEAGCDDFVAKPVDGKIMLDAIQQQLQRIGLDTKSHPKKTAP